MELNKICRICLKSDLLVSIFSPTFLLRPVEMVEKLNIFKVDDILSKFLCQTCLYHIIHISKELTQLQQLAQESERQMREYLRCNENIKQEVSAVTAQRAIQPNKSTTFSNEVTNFCDIFQTAVVQEEGTDDMLNDVEIDVSSLTRSEADDTLSEVFVDGQLNCHFETDARHFAEDIGDDNATVFENVLETTSEANAVKIFKPWLNKRKSKVLKDPEKCFECGKTFRTIGYLAKHQRLHTGEKPFICKLCARRFCYLSNLRLHQQVHDRQQRRFQCEICAKFLTTSSNLKAHRLTHKEERSFQCEKCIKCFKSARELRRHEPIHNTSKNHKCELCEKMFRKRCYLRAHILAVHRNEKKHKCKECDKVFATKSNLKCHTRIHTGEKPFQCKYCTWKFNQTSALIRHVQKKHQHNIVKSQNKASAIGLPYEMPVAGFPINDSNEQLLTRHNDITETLNIYNASTTKQNYELSKVCSTFYKTTS